MNKYSVSVFEELCNCSKNNSNFNCYFLYNECDFIDCDSFFSCIK